MNSSLCVRLRSGIAAVCAALVVTACGSSSPGALDADSGAGPRDAQIIDAVTVFDAPRDAGGGGPDAQAPPIAPTCDMGECDPRVGDSCAAGGICEVRRGTTVCSEDPAVGVMEGENCYAAHDCQPGLICSIGGALEVGVCRRPCCPRDGDGECREGERCAFPARDPANAWAWSWGRCVPPRPCDPLAPGPVCDFREGCYIVGADGRTDCLNAGTEMVTGACERQNDCGPGLYCARQGQGVGSCVRICSLSGERASCLPGEGRCVEYAHTPEGMGLCTNEPRPT